jgi:SAM-dependent methyltransferase
MNQSREISDCGLAHGIGELAAVGSKVCCPICKSRKLISWALVSEHKYVSCCDCGVAYMEPTPDFAELQNFYNECFQVNRESQARKIEGKSDALLKILNRFLPKKGRLLEIGCSYGHFLRRAKQDGWGVEGVEISRTAADWARETFGIAAYPGTLEEALPSLKPPYDAVVMLHVLEHAPEPARLVSQIREVLRPGGVLLAKTPNSASWIAHICGRTWEWLTPPAHIFLFSPLSLRLLLEHAGFQVELLGTQRGDAHNTLFEIVRSMAKRVFRASGHAPASGTPTSRRSWYHRVEAASDFLYRPFELAENIFFRRQLRHPELLVVARRLD